MNNTIDKLKNIFHPNIFSNLQLKRFPKGSVVSHYYDKSILIVTKGYILAVRYYDNYEYIAPYRFSEGDVIGFYGNYIVDDCQWEFKATSDCEVLVIPEDIVKEVVLKDFSLYRYFNEESAKIWSQVLKVFYIRFQGGSKSIFAFFLGEYSKNNILHFIKTENFIKAMNISRTMLFKIEKEFIEKGIIKKTRNHYTVLDRERLEEYYKDIIYLNE